MFTVDIFHKLPKIVFMPPSWPRKPNREDPAYRKLDDRMNFAVHLAILAATNSGLWFFHIFIRTNKQ